MDALHSERIAMRDVAEILKAIAWPIAVSIMFFYLRFQLTSLAGALVSKVHESRNIKLRGAGLVFEMASQVARASIAPTSKTNAAESDKDEFDRLAREYQGLDIADLKERVAQRFKLADRLGELAVSLELPRKNLASGNEGELVALATAAVMQPKARDLTNLQVAAKRVAFKFTAYRLVLAIPTLANEDNLRQATIARLEEMLTDIGKNSKSNEDPDLQELIDTTRHTLADLRIQIG
jgi:hypothetical protein